jgi:hypothetical protein
MSAIFCAYNDWLAEFCRTDLGDLLRRLIQAWTIDVADEHVGALCRERADDLPADAGCTGRHQNPMIGHCPSRSGEHAGTKTKRQFRRQSVAKPAPLLHFF